MSTSSSPSHISDSESGEENVNVFSLKSIKAIKKRQTNIRLPADTFYSKKVASSSANVCSSVQSSSSSPSKNLRTRQPHSAKVNISLSPVDSPVDDSDDDKH